MAKLEGLSTKISETREQGNKNVEIGEQKLEEADSFKGALDGLDQLDENTQDIIDTATEGAQEVASEQVSAIKESMEDVSENLSEVTDEATEYAGVEHQNAEGVSDASGDYGSVASRAESSFEQHEEQFEEIGENAQEINNEFTDSVNEMTNKLDSLF